MSNISQYTEQIRKAVYGKQVRSSIANAIDELDEVVTEHGSSIDTAIENAEKAIESAKTIESAKADAIILTESSETIARTDTAESKLEGLTVFGHSNQKSYSGKNLCNANNATVQEYYMITLDNPLSAGTYWLSFNAVSDDTDSDQCLVSFRMDASTYIHIDCARNTRVKKQVTLTDTSQYIFLYASNSFAHSEGDTAVFSDIMISTEDVAYEPYTGGVASPNPDYPQEVVSAGQKSYSGKNLLDLGRKTSSNSDKYEVGYTVTKDGLTATVLQDGGIEITGTKTTDGWTNIFFVTFAEPYTIPPGTYTLGSKSNVLIQTEINNGTKNYANTFTTETEVTVTGYYITYQDPQTVNDVIYIMLNAGNTALPWEPYTGGVEKPYAVGIETRVYGKNLFSNVFADYVRKKDYFTCPIDLSEGIYYASANLIGSLITGIVIAIVPYGEKYEEFSTVLKTVVDINGNVISQPVMIDSNWSSPKFVVYCSGETQFNEIFKNYAIQFETGSTATSYEPYLTPQLLPYATPNGLPGIQVTDASLANYTDSDGKMWACDYRDWERGVDVTRIAEYAFTGDESFADYIAEYGSMSMYFSHAPGSLGICTHAVWGDFMVWWANENAIGFDASYFNVTSTEEFKTWLAECSNAGNPLKVLYVLHEPTETPILEDELEAYRALHSNYPSTTIMNDAGCHMKAGMVADTKNHIEQNYTPNSEFKVLADRVSALEKNTVSNT